MYSQKFNSKTAVASVEINDNTAGNSNITAKYYIVLFNPSKTYLYK